MNISVLTPGLVRVCSLASLVIFAILLAACQLAPDSSTPTQFTQPSLMTPVETMKVTTSSESTGCNELEITEIIWPQLVKVEPDQAAPGEKVTVTGSGGFFHCGSFYNESAHQFQLYFDEEPLSQITCYANHCQTSLSIPTDVATGEHVIKAEGSSQLKILINKP